MGTPAYSAPLSPASTHPDSSARLTALAYSLPSPPALPSMASSGVLDAADIPTPPPLPARDSPRAGLPSPPGMDDVPRRPPPPPPPPPMPAVARPDGAKGERTPVPTPPPPPPPPVLSTTELPPGRAPEPPEGRIGDNSAEPKRDAGIGMEEPVNSSAGQEKSAVHRGADDAAVGSSEAAPVGREVTVSFANATTTTPSSEETTTSTTDRSVADHDVSKDEASTMSIEGSKHSVGEGQEEPLPTVPSKRAVLERIKQRFTKSADEKTIQESAAQVQNRKPPQENTAAEPEIVPVPQVPSADAVAAQPVNNAKETPSTVREPVPVVTPAPVNTTSDLRPSALPRLDFTQLTEQETARSGAVVRRKETTNVISSVVSKLPNPIILFMGLLAFLFLLYAISPDLLRNIFSRIVFPPLLFAVSGTSLFWKRPALSPDDNPLVVQQQRDIDEAEARLRASEARLEEMRRELDARIPAAEDLTRKLAAAAAAAAAATPSPSTSPAPPKPPSVPPGSALSTPPRPASSRATERQSPMGAVIPGDVDEVAAAKRDIAAMHSHAAGNYEAHSQGLRKKYLLGQRSADEAEGAGKLGVFRKGSRARSAGARTPRDTGSGRSEFRSFFYAVLPGGRARRKAEAGSEVGTGPTGARNSRGVGVTGGGAASVVDETEPASDPGVANT